MRESEGGGGHGGNGRVCFGFRIVVGGGFGGDCGVGKGLGMQGCRVVERGMGEGGAAVGF